MSRTKSSAGARSAGKRRNGATRASRSATGASSGNKGRRHTSNSPDWSNGVIDLARERPIAAAAVAAGAAAAGLFLWSKRAQISSQLSNLSNQVGEWTDNIATDISSSALVDDTAGLTTSSSRPRSPGRARNTIRRTNKSAGGNSSSVRATSSAPNGSNGEARTRDQATVAAQE